MRDWAMQMEDDLWREYNEAALERGSKRGPHVVDASNEDETASEHANVRSEDTCKTERE